MNGDVIGSRSEEFRCHVVLSITYTWFLSPLSLFQYPHVWAVPQASWSPLKDHIIIISCSPDYVRLLTNCAWLISPSRASSCRPLRPPLSFPSNPGKISVMPPASPTIHSTLGAIFVGFALACGVYGVLTSQIFSYFRNYPSDKLHFKLLVRIPAYMRFT